MASSHHLSGTSSTPWTSSALMRRAAFATSATKKSTPSQTRSVDSYSRASSSAALRSTSAMCCIPGPVGRRRRTRPTWPEARLTWHGGDPRNRLSCGSPQVVASFPIGPSRPRSTRRLLPCNGNRALHKASTFAMLRWLRCAGYVSAADRSPARSPIPEPSAALHDSVPFRISFVHRHASYFPSTARNSLFTPRYGAASLPTMRTSSDVNLSSGAHGFAP